MFGPTLTIAALIWAFCIIVVSIAQWIQGQRMLSTKRETKGKLLKDFM
jgi:hypothetical protein